MRLYNTASRKVETLKPRSDVVKIYTCGPTVYAQAHIGNLTAYIYWDLLVRALKAEGLSVKRVQSVRGRACTKLRMDISSYLRRTMLI